MAFGNSLLRPIYRYRHCRFELQCELHCLMHVARGIVQHTRLHFRYPYYTHRLTTLSRPLLASWSPRLLYIPFDPCVFVTTTLCFIYFSTIKTMNRWHFSRTFIMCILFFVNIQSQVFTFPGFSYLLFRYCSISCCCCPW